MFQSESRNARSAARSALRHGAELLSRRVPPRRRARGWPRLRSRARPSWSRNVCPLTLAMSPSPQSGGVRHSRPVAANAGRSSARPSPMSCRSRSVYGRMVWLRELRQLRRRTRFELRDMTGAAARARRTAAVREPPADRRRCARPARPGCARRAQPRRKILSLSSGSPPDRWSSRRIARRARVILVAERAAR